MPIRYAFHHGDGTTDRTSESRAFYEAPGVYAVSMSWEYAGDRGTIDCGTVSVSAGGPTPTPTPTPTPGSTAVQISCTIQYATVRAFQTQQFTAYQQPANVAVSYVFDHGDGTLDPGSTSEAYYQSAGVYNVALRWSHAAGSGQTPCGTVTVLPAFYPSDYIGRAYVAAEATAAAKSFTTRVLRIDDQWFAGTQDYQIGRVNFEIDNGIVTVATNG